MMKLEMKYRPIKLNCIGDGKNAEGQISEPRQNLPSGKRSVRNKKKDCRSHVKLAWLSNHCTKRRTPVGRSRVSVDRQSHTRCPSSQRRAALGPVATLLHVVHGGEVDAAALGVLDGRIHVASLRFVVINFLKQVFKDVLDVVRRHS